MNRTKEHKPKKASRKPTEEVTKPLKETKKTTTNSINLKRYFFVDRNNNKGYITKEIIEFLLRIKLTISNNIIDINEENLTKLQNIVKKHSFFHPGDCNWERFQESSLTKLKMFNNRVFAYIGSINDEETVLRFLENPKTVTFSRSDFGLFNKIFISLDLLNYPDFKYFIVYAETKKSKTIIISIILERLFMDKLYFFSSSFDDQIYNNMKKYFGEENIVNCQIDDKKSYFLKDDQYIYCRDLDNIWNSLKKIQSLSKEIEEDKYIVSVLGEDYDEEIQLLQSSIDKEWEKYDHLKIIFNSYFGEDAPLQK
jgi:hypothetical protein